MMTMAKILRKMNVGMMSALCAAFALCLISICPQEALAQAYPTKPIRIIVTSTAGAGGDIVARLVGGKLTEFAGQQVIVDNRAGAGGRIAAELAARSAPDGYTLMMMTATLTIVNAMYEKLNYDLVGDFAPVCLLGTTPFVLVVNPAVPATSVQELVALAKARPGAMKYGSGGSGSTFHLSAEIFKHLTGTDIMHVPYKGGTPPMTNTLSGEVEMSIQPIAQALPLIKSGKLRPLGVTSAKRTPLLPDLPAIAETVPGYEFIGFYGLVAPAKTPAPILAKLNADLLKTMNTAAVRERMTALGIDALGTSRQEYASFITDQLEKMKVAVKLSGARPAD
jgi:tripartite-type tricarboxylate transporter receptor subunit TctC